MKITSRIFSILRNVLSPLALGFAAWILCAASYNLPGPNNTNSAAGDGTFAAGNHALARDSNGYWYFVSFKNSTALTGGGPIVLAYTTTTTPSASTDWALLTLVASGGTSPIGGSQSTAIGGMQPYIAIGTDDVLHFIWDDGGNTANAFRWNYWNGNPELGVRRGRQRASNQLRRQYRIPSHASRLCGREHAGRL